MDKDLLLEAHEDRITRVEGELRETSTQVLPALARLEAITTAGFARLDERLARTEARLAEVEADFAMAASQDTARDSTVAALLLAENQRKERRAAVVKWVAGLIGSVVVALVLVLLGLK